MSDMQLEELLPRIRRVVGKIAKNGDVIDDISQECCVRIIEREELWSRKEGTLWNWLDTVSKNVAINFTLRMRKRGQRTQSLVGDVEGKPPDTDISEEQIAWVLGQFVHLTESQREVLHLHYYEGMTVVEIAKKLNISHPSVSERLSKGLRTLRKRARAEGLLGVLLPWNWDAKGWLKAGETVVKYKVSTGVSVCVLLLLLGGVSVLYSVMNEKDNKGSRNSTGVANVRKKQPDRVLVDKSHVEKSLDSQVTPAEPEDDIKESLEATLAWLKEIGPNRFRKLTLNEMKILKELKLSTLDFNEDDLKYLRNIPLLTSLSLQNTKVTDVGLVHLQNLPIAFLLHNPITCW